MSKGMRRSYAAVQKNRRVLIPRYVSVTRPVSIAEFLWRYASQLVRYWYCYLIYGYSGHYTAQRPYVYRPNTHSIPVITTTDVKPNPDYWKTVYGRRI